MRELKLKDLLPHYEHGLKVLNTEDNRIYLLTVLSNPFKTVRRDFLTLQIREPASTRSWSFVLDNKTSHTVKPILRHLSSDLTKEIEHNGEKFVPIVELLKLSSSGEDWLKKHPEGKYSEIHYEQSGLYAEAYITYHCTVNIALHTGCVNDWPYWVIEKLHEWHFDTSNLIKDGLAIDINTL